MTEHKLVLNKYMKAIASVLLADAKVKSLTLFFPAGVEGDWRAELLVPITGQDTLGVVTMDGKHLDAINEDTPEHLLNLDAALLGAHISRITMIRSTVMGSGTVVAKATDRHGQLVWFSTLVDPAIRQSVRNPRRRGETEVAVVTKPELMAILDDKRGPKSKSPVFTSSNATELMADMTDVDYIYESSGLPGLMNCYPEHNSTFRLEALSEQYPDLNGAPNIHVVTPRSMSDRAICRTAYIRAGGRDLPQEFMNYESEETTATRLLTVVARVDFTQGVSRQIRAVVRDYAKSLAASHLTVLLARNALTDMVEEFHSVWDRGHGRTAYMAVESGRSVRIMGSHQINGMHKGDGPNRVDFDLMEVRGTKYNGGYDLYLSFVARINGQLVGDNVRTRMVQRVGNYVIDEDLRAAVPGTKVASVPKSVVSPSACPAVAYEEGGYQELKLHFPNHPSTEKLKEAEVSGRAHHIISSVSPTLRKPEKQQFSWASGPLEIRLQDISRRPNIPGKPTLFLDFVGTSPDMLRSHVETEIIRKLGIWVASAFSHLLERANVIPETVRLMKDRDCGTGHTFLSWEDGDRYGYLITDTKDDMAGSLHGPGIPVTRVEVDVVDAILSRNTTGYHVHATYVALCRGKQRAGEIPSILWQVPESSTTEPGTIAEPVPEDSGGEHF